MFLITGEAAPIEWVDTVALLLRNADLAAIDQQTFMPAIHKSLYP
jgi:hypothetical protein